jgi:gamma-glutamylcyclotransferase (GGCT)/AIG2-like uncharacterized protein YtfP
MTTSALYTYGTLQVPAIIALIVGRPLVGQPARLPGYSRFRIQNRVYPAIIPAAGGDVPGILYPGLEVAELERLDHYEGEIYERRELNVLVAEESVPACTYVLRPEHVHRLSEEPWDLGQFEREHLASYLARVAVTSRAP